ncbi:MAG TPA: hypothetical protein VFP87_14280 [Chitinophagaceae bacterium]|nr:hypothetical protein [Chitinophagaceae bacterium]
MKKISILFMLTALLATGRALAQSKDTVPAKKIIEQGTKGDIIVGNENKKKQLTAAPQVLRQRDSTQKAPSAKSKKKKCRNKNQS